MKNHIIELLEKNGYANTGDNRNYTIKSLNILLDSGFLSLYFIPYSESKTHSYMWEKDGKRYGTLYQFSLFGKRYNGNWMPKKTRTILCWGMGEVVNEKDYSVFPIDAILKTVARRISLSREGFDFIRDGSCNCVKCNGRGIIPEFMYYADGVCFDCGGTGIDRHYLQSYIKSNISSVK